MSGVAWLPRQGRCHWCGLLNGLVPSDRLEETFTKPIGVSFVGHLYAGDFSERCVDFNIATTAKPRGYWLDRAQKTSREDVKNRNYRRRCNDTS